jgi:hypothetical protein
MKPEWFPSNEEGHESQIIEVLDITKPEPIRLHTLTN